MTCRSKTKSKIDLHVKMLYSLGGKTWNGKGSQMRMKRKGTESKLESQV